MKIAILGATGMIGNHCARAALTRDHEVRVVHRAGSDLRHLEGLEVETRVADLDDEPALREALRGVDAVIHSAGYYPPGVPRGWRVERDLARAQMERFFRACDWDRLAKVVFVGSVVALPRHPRGLPATEDLEFRSAPATRTPYVHVKYEMDLMARDQARAGRPVVVAIPGMCLGEYDKGPTTGKLVMAIANRALPGYVRGRRNVVYTGDAARGMVLACEQGIAGRRYLFAGTNVTLSALVKQVAAIAGVPPPRLGIPPFVARALAALLGLKHRLFGGREPLLTSTAIAVSSGQFLDASRTEAELGYRASTPLDEAVRRTLDWFRSAGYVR